MTQAQQATLASSSSQLDIEEASASSRRRHSINVTANHETTTSSSLLSSSKPMIRSGSTRDTTKLENHIQQNNEMGQAALTNTSSSSAPGGSTNTSSKLKTLEEAPRSGRLPLTHKFTRQSKEVEPKLIPPILARVPMQVRFMLNGLISNILFVWLYNWAVVSASNSGLAPSTVYMGVYLLYIPLSHLMVSLFVFGWPENRYCRSLCSNMPIGLTAMAMGASLTAYLDRLQWDARVEEYLIAQGLVSAMGKPPRMQPTGDTNSSIEAAAASSSSGEFYSSVVVLIITSLWTYVLSVYINAPPTTDDKKEL